MIDTGVNRHPRLRSLQPGGDFVSNSDGTVDCDGRGTLAAGLIAAQPSPHDAFAGIAPDASILSIRELSLAYQATNSPLTGQIYRRGYGSVTTLAASVVRAVDEGATVIDIPAAACTTAGDLSVDGALGAAVQYAAERNVVVVAAAGDLHSDSSCSDQNIGSGWGGVKTVASPAWFSRYVLAVASTDLDGSVSPFSIHGPWIGVAAPGRNIVSLDSTPGGTGLVDAVQGSEGPVPHAGTGYSSAYVAGLAALVRTRFPALTAAQVIERIERTAKHPGPGRDDTVGYGLIDPLAALTADAPPQPGHAAFTPRVASTLSVALLVALGIITSILLRRRRAVRP
ncbi:type VII secretion-associated serine protease mycosin [Nocardia sp. CA-135953]|uniref:type VII secretion-associated serine protease mycosin n=1 Tax=Nocardia sp. CA-135953 TaxID=3239978 RepID=UPI003D9699DF